MRRFDRLLGKPEAEERMDVIEYAQLIQQGWPGGLGMSWTDGKAESPPNSFVGFSQSIYKASGPVFAVVSARMRVFSEVRFQFRRYSDGTLFGRPALRVLEEPWPNGTTRDLLARMEQDVSICGNSYIVREAKDGVEFLRRLRPDWVRIITDGEPEDPNATVAGITYYPGGTGDPVIYEIGQFAHFAPIPDPDANWRGMSWLTPVIEEAVADRQMTRYKRKTMDNNGTPNFAVSLKESVSPEAFERFRQAYNAQHAGADNAGKTLFMGGGADFTLLGTDWKSLDLKSVQGGGETRIAAAGGVPAIVAGLSEGLEAATYSNFASARRLFGDLWARPQWGLAAASLAPLVEVPEGSELWYDPAGVSFLQEDERDAAEISQQQQVTISGYVEAGFTPASAVAAVQNANLSLLQHTGMVSVQLQTPGSTPTPSPTA